MKVHDNLRNFRENVLDQKIYIKKFIVNIL